MDNSKIQLIGAPCGHHGQYTFYKGFKYYKNGRYKILALSDFFFVKLWSDLDLMSIGELQLLWIDKNNDQMLASLRLYFLPENTPEGRNDDHGEDEVLAISEKVVLRVEDLLDRIAEEAAWDRGLAAVCERDCAVVSGDEAVEQPAPGDGNLDFGEVIKEKKLLAEDGRPEPNIAVVVLSFPRYCRYRGILKRLEGVANKWLRNTLVVALGGFAVQCRNTRILFCKETFDYPDLEGHELLCNHLAPNLKGRPRRKRKKRSTSPGGSESNESESSLSTVASVPKTKLQSSRSGLRCSLAPQRRTTGPSSDEKEFLSKLHHFMRARRTPIERVPHLGFKEIDLYAFFRKVQALGGYGAVTAARAWKAIYDELGGHQGSTSAATCTRRHYERLLLPYELNERGTEAVPASPDKVIRTRSEAEREKENAVEIIPEPVQRTSEARTSSLRSVRPKADRLATQESTGRPKDKENIPLSNVSRSALPPAPEVRGEVEVIDLASEPDSPAKTPVKTSPAVPVLKKRKLEILREGGLEVTPVAATALPQERRPSVIQHAPLTPPSGQVSITVTPDVGHMLQGSPPSDWNPPPRSVTQSRSIYAHSENTVYGNPKDGLGSSHISRRRLDDVLDLRVQPRGVTVPIVGGRAMVGSNLEITVVDSPAPPRRSAPPPPPPVRRSPPPSRHHHNGRGPPRLPSGTELVIPRYPATPTPHYPSYMPLVDPVWALYGGLYPPPNYVPPPVFCSPLYKELMARHAPQLGPPPPAILGLPRDGSVSITPVAPTSK